MQTFFENIQWEPRIGDPSFMGWFTVGMYFITSVSCLLTWHAYRIRGGKNRNEILWWGGLTGTLFLLGINKQLDLQSLFTAIGKVIAKSLDWYDQRRMVQLIFVIGMVIITALALVFIFQKFKYTMRKRWLSVFGLIFLISFIIIRAASFHHMEVILDWRIIGFRLNWLFELTGIACIGVSSVFDQVQLKQNRWQ